MRYIDLSWPWRSPGTGDWAGGTAVALMVVAKPRHGGLGWWGGLVLCVAAWSRLLLVVEADGSCHLVEVEALVSTDEPLVVVVLPWSEHEELSLCTGVEPAASGLGKRGEAVLLEHYDWETLLEGCLHDGFFAGADAWRDEHGTILSMRKEMPAFLGNLLSGQAAAALHLHQAWGIQ